MASFIHVEQSTGAKVFADILVITLFAYGYATSWNAIFKTLLVAYFVLKNSKIKIFLYA